MKYVSNLHFAFDRLPEWMLIRLYLFIIRIVHIYRPHECVFCMLQWILNHSVRNFVVFTRCRLDAAEQRLHRMACRWRECILPETHTKLSFILRPTANNKQTTKEENTKNRNSGKSGQKERVCRAEKRDDDNVGGEKKKQNKSIIIFIRSYFMLKLFGFRSFSIAGWLRWINHEMRKTK